jgi:hypothetical protein
MITFGRDAVRDWSVNRLLIWEKPAMNDMTLISSEGNPPPISRERFEAICFEMLNASGIVWWNRLVANGYRLKDGTPLTGEAHLRAILAKMAPTTADVWQDLYPMRQLLRANNLDPMLATRKALLAINEVGVSTLSDSEKIEIITRVAEEKRG